MRFLSRSLGIKIENEKLKTFTLDLATSSVAALTSPISVLI